MENKDRDIDTELINAVLDDDIGRVKELIAGGADVNAVDIADWTALMYATWYGHTETVKELIAAGADVNMITKYGWDAWWKI